MANKKQKQKSDCTSARRYFMLYTSTYVELESNKGHSTSFATQVGRDLENTTEIKPAVVDGC